MFRTLRSRIWLAIALTVLLALCLTLLVASLGWQDGLGRVRGRELQRQAAVLAILAAQPARGAFSAAATELRRDGERVENVSLSAAARLLEPPERSELTAGRPLMSTVTLDGVEYLAGVRRTGDSAVLVMLSVEELGGYGMPAWVPILALGLGVAVAVAAAFVIALAVVRPLRRVAAASHELAAGRTPQPLAVKGPVELRQLAESFNTMARQLAEAREAERTFLRSVSHELRTPIAAVEGFAQAQKDGVVSADEASAMILVEGRRLERLVQDLLDLARLQQTEFALDVREIDLADIAADVVQRYELRAGEFGVTLAAVAGGPAAGAPACPDGPAAPARGDPDRVLQAVSNLVENGLRVTPEGGVVTVVVEPGVVEVRDTGPGLPPEDLERAFERFYLYRRSSSSRIVGSGLGLALVRELVTAMGGSVTVRSEAGRGAAFRISLPSGG